MKQEFITSFLMQRGTKLSVEDAMKIQSLLKTTSDDAYPILMGAKTPVNPWKIVLYIISIGLFLIFCYGTFDSFFASYYIYWEGFFIAIPFLLGSIGALIGAICIKSRKKRILENYIKIILAYKMD
jgi:hypothetical protein